MANPFYVAPARFGPALQGLAGSVEKYGEQKKAQEEKDALEQRQQAGRQALTAAVQSDDPLAIRQVMIDYPDLQEQAKSIFGFTNEQTERIARDTYRQALSDPDRFGEIMRAGAERVKAFNGRPVNMLKDAEMFDRNPEAAIRGARAGYAALASDQEFKAMFPELAGGAGGGLGTYNPRDYTTDSWAAFVKTRDPSVLQRFAALKTVNVGGVDYVFDPADPQGTMRPATIRGTGAQAGGAATPSQVLTPEIVAQNKATIAQAEAEATEKGKQAGAQTGAETKKDIKASIDKSQETLGVIDELLASDLGAITGLSGITPTILPSSRGLVATAKRLEAMLTSENLGIMSGVLTDKDIELIKSIGSGLEVSDSGIPLTETDTRKRLNQIKEKLQRGIQNKMDELFSESSQPEAPESVDDFINSVIQGGGG